MTVKHVADVFKTDTHLVLAVIQEYYFSIYPVCPGGGTKSAFVTSIEPGQPVQLCSLYCWLAVNFKSTKVKSEQDLSILLDGHLPVLIFISPELTKDRVTKIEGGQVH